MSSNHSAKTTEANDDVQDRHQRQQAMITACSTGNLQQLQDLFPATGIEQCDGAVQSSGSSSDLRDISTLLAHAVLHSHLNIVAYLLSTYPTAPVVSVLGLALAHPDLAIFDLLHKRDPGIVHHEFESGETALMVACRDGSGRPLLPTFLLDHGADPNESGLGLTGPLAYAIEYGQPLVLIKKMVEAGAFVRVAPVIVAVRSHRTDVLEYFVDRCTIYDQEVVKTVVRNDVERSGSQEMKQAFNKWLEMQAGEPEMQALGRRCLIL
ncbi:MAG: hypothetical protein Q9213_002688 [Squamulea squamosa]